MVYVVVRHATVVLRRMTGSFKSIKEERSTGMMGVLLSNGWAVLHPPGKVFFFFLVVVERVPFDWMRGLLFNFSSSSFLDSELDGSEMFPPLRDGS